MMNEVSKISSYEIRAYEQNQNYINPLKDNLVTSRKRKDLDNNIEHYKINLKDFTRSPTYSQTQRPTPQPTRRPTRPTPRPTTAFPTSSPTIFPTNGGTSAPTSGGTSAPTSAVSASRTQSNMPTIDFCKFELDFELNTDEYAEDTSWKVNDQSAKTLKEGGSYVSQFFVVREKICAYQFGLYELNINDRYGDGIGACEKGGEKCGKYFMKVNGYDLFEGNGKFGSGKKVKFGLCSNDSHCDDGDSCTKDTCNNRNICTYEKIPCQDCVPHYSNCELLYYCVPSPCAECSKRELTVVVEADASSSDISWDINDFHTGSSVLNIEKGTYTINNFKYTHSICTEYKMFNFTIINEAPVQGRDERKWNGKYDIRLDDHIIANLDGRTTRDFDRDEVVFGFCETNSDCNDGNVCTADYCRVDKGICNHETLEECEECIKENGFSSNCPSIGDRAVLAIRVIAVDSETTSSADDISNYIFGTNGKELTMKSQFNACSYNKLTMSPFIGDTETNEFIPAGVGEVEISSNVQGVLTGTVVNQVLSAAIDKYGHLERQFQFVMLCLPPGTITGDTTDWKAYAYMNQYLSVYNDNHCNSPSVQMHELGHNIGLSHSHDHESYGDWTGFMGITTLSIEGPRKCFNAPKSWELGWYQSGHEIIEPKRKLKNEYFLTGISEYMDRGDFSVILKIIGSNDGYDYYAMFNLASGMNSETEEGVNKLQITRQKIGESIDYDSLLVASELNEDQPYTISGFDNSVNVVIRPYYHFNHEPPYVQVIIQKLSLNCETNKECDDADPCTIDTCVQNTGFDSKTCQHEPMECSECGNMVNVQVKTGNHPDQLSWEITDIESNRIFLSSGYFKDSYRYYDRSKCLPFVSYTILFFHGNATDVEDARFWAWTGDGVDQKEIDSDKLNSGEWVEAVFIICKTNDDCENFDGCSISECSSISKLCEHTKTDNCDECTPVQISIIFDNYPEEISWNLYNINDNDLVLTGDPYPMRVREFGRRSKPTRSGRRSKPTRQRAPKTDSIRRNLIYDENKQSLMNVDNSIQDDICLIYGYKYHFKIEDSFGDGICCEEGQGGYTFMIHDEKVKIGGNFTYSEEFYFKHVECTQHDSCDDSNSCTIDRCHSEISTCIYSIKPCNECGAFVFVHVITDWTPFHNSWEIRSNGNQYLHGGPYKEAYQENIVRSCLPFGEYKFIMHDLNKDGMSECHSSSVSCGYNLYVNEELRVTGGFKGESFARKVQIFTISSPTLPPTMTPTKPPIAGCPKRHISKCQKKCSSNPRKLTACLKNCKYNVNAKCPVICPTKHQLNCNKRCKKRFRSKCKKDCKFKNWKSCG